MYQSLCNQPIEINFLQRLQSNDKILLTTTILSDVIYILNNDSVRVTDCKVSPKNYLCIIEGKTETGQEIKLLWGEQHFQLLKNTAPCTETITEFETLKQQINTDRCVGINELHTVFLVVCKKEAIELLDDKLKEYNIFLIPIIVIVVYQ